jgi:Cof subfamily protein (haloacid dehalogenase superfamily)
VDAIEVLRQMFPQATPQSGPLPDESIVRDLLRHDPQRIRHVFGVVRTAAELGHSLGHGQSFARALTQAALWHDLGYSPSLRITGFHPLDAAIFLASRAAPYDVTAAVLFHSGAAGEAVSHPCAARTYQALSGKHAGLLGEALTFCDLRTLPSGETCTAAERLLEITARYGPEHMVTRNMHAHRVEFRRTCAVVLDCVANAASSTLPWVFVDVDSTLVAPGGALSPENRHAMLSYLRAGGRISLATGKHPAAFKELADDLGDAGPHIAGNGALVVDSNQCELLSDISESVPELEQRLRDSEVPYAVYTEAGIIINESTTNADHIQELLSIREPAPSVGSISASQPVFKILTFVDRNEINRELQLRELADRTSVSCVRTSAKFLEFISSAGGKGLAVETILGRTGWPLFHSVGIGDSENDLPMLRRCGMAVAVANANETVLSAADLVVRSCGDNGVAHYLAELESRRLEA